MSKQNTRRQLQRHDAFSLPLKVREATYREAERQEFERSITPMPQIYGFTVRKGMRVVSSDSEEKTLVEEHTDVLCDGCGQEQKPGTRMVAIGSATVPNVECAIICPNCVAQAVALAS
jgi:hypothetical protein